MAVRLPEGRADRRPIVTEATPVELTMARTFLEPPMSTGMLMPPGTGTPTMAPAMAVAAAGAAAGLAVGTVVGTLPAAAAAHVSGGSKLLL